MSLRQKIVKNSIYNATHLGIEKIGALIFTIIVARLLQPHLYGIYTLVLSLASIILVFADLGLNQTLIRFVSDALGENKQTLARSYFRYLLKIKIILLISVSIAIFLLAKPLANIVFNKPDLILPLQILPFFLVFASLFSFLSLGGVYAIQKIKYAVITTSIHQALRIILVSLIILLGHSVFGVFVGLGISFLVVMILLLSIIYKKHKYLIFGKIQPIDNKRIKRFLSYLTISMVSTVLFMWVDTLMLGVLSTAENVGYYRAAFSVVFAIAGIITLTGVLLPVFTQIKDRLRLKSVFQKTIRYSVMFSLPAAFGLAYLAKPTIQIIFGTAYSPAVAPLFILSFLIIEIATGSFFSNIFNALEKPEWPTYIIIISTIINIVLNYVLIIKYGIVGAAIATVTARYLSFVAISALAKIKLNIMPILSDIAKPLISAIVMYVVLYTFVPVTSMISGFVALLLGVVIYFVMLVLLKGINKEDVKLLKLFF